MSCEKYYDCFYLCPSTVTTFLDKIKDREFSKESEIIRELDLMIKCIPLYKNSIVRYASHRLRAKAQFSAIKKFMSEMKQDNSIILFIIDHKQKVNLLIYLEAQVEYFG